MIDLKIKRDVNKPIDEVWNVITKEFASIGVWATGVYKSRPGKPEENCDRVCSTSFGLLKEKIILKDKKNYILKFTVTGLPFFVTSLQSTWSLKKLSKTSTQVTINPQIKTMFLIGTIMEIPMRSNLTKTLKIIADDFVTYVQTGKVSKQKREELKKNKL